MSDAKLTKERLERASRIYKTNQAAAEAMGINSSSFSRACDRHGVTPPSQQRKSQPISDRKKYYEPLYHNSNGRDFDERASDDFSG